MLMHLHFMRIFCYKLSIFNLTICNHSILNLNKLIIYKLRSM